MTSLKQIEANRRNALKSTDPRSEDGKQRASRNAVRHGLTAETVIEPLEDPETLFTREGMRWRSSSARYPRQQLWRRRTEAPPD